MKEGLRRPEVRQEIGERVRWLAQTAFMTILGLVLSQARVLGGYAPFGAAFVAAVPMTSALPVGLGAAFGYILGGGAGMPLRYVAAIMLVMTLRWSMTGLGRITRHPAFSVTVGFVATAGTGIAMTSLSGFEPASLLFSLSEGLLAAGGTYFFAIAIGLMRRERQVASLSKQELCGVMVTAGAAIVALTRISFYGVSPGRILAVLLVLCAARYGYEAAGAVTGITTGLMMSLAGADLGHLGGAYAFGGLMGGVFAPLGQIGVAVVFFLCNGIVALQTGGSPAVYAGIYEVVIGSALFFLIPRRAGAALSRALSPRSDLPLSDGLRRSMAMRLSFAADSLADVSRAVEAVTVRLKAVCAPSVSGVYTRACDRVCKGCGLRMFCWGPAYSDTQNALGGMSETLRERDILRAEDVEENFAKRCCRLKELVDEVNGCYRDFSVRERAERRVSEVRTVVVDQFNGMSQMLGELAEEMEEADRFDLEAAARVGEVLGNAGIQSENVCCMLDGFDRMTVQILALGVDRVSIDRAQLTHDLSQVCGRVFDPPGFAWAGEAARITFNERAALAVEFGHAQLSSGDGVLCGDACSCFFDGRGRAVMMISDGMGSGGRAAVEGNMAASLMEQLIKAGFGFDSSLGVVNSALLVKSQDEALATLDIACIDLYTGEMRLFKAGAPLTLIRKNGRVTRCDLTSLPLGILREVTFQRADYRLRADDALLMVSDGVLGGGTDWIEAEFDTPGKCTAQQLADRIATQARKRRVDGRDDDITVVVAMIKRGV